MNKIGFVLGGVTFRAYDAAIITAHDNGDLASAVADAVVSSISTDVQITLGGVTMHLAAFMDPDHWEDDWRAAGVEDVEAWLAGLGEAEAT